MQKKSCKSTEIKCWIVTEMCWNNNYYHWYRNSLLYMTALAFQRCICQYMLTWLCIHLCRIITDYLENFSDDKKNSMNLWEVIVKAHARYVEVCCSSCLSVRALTLLFADNFCCISSFFLVSNWSHDIDPINVLFLLLGQCFSKKVYGSIVLNRISMKFARFFLLLNTQ